MINKQMAAKKIFDWCDRMNTYLADVNTEKFNKDGIIQLPNGDFVQDKQIKSARESIKKYWAQFTGTTYEDYIDNQGDKENYTIIIDQDTGERTYMKRKDVLV